MVAYFSNSYYGLGLGPCEIPKSNSEAPRLTARLCIGNVKSTFTYLIICSFSQQHSPTFRQWTVSHQPHIQCRTMFRELILVRSEASNHWSAGDKWMQGAVQEHRGVCENRVFSQKNYLTQSLTVCINRQPLLCRHSTTVRKSFLFSQNSAQLCSIYKLQSDIVQPPLDLPRLCNMQTYQYLMIQSICIQPDRPLHYIIIGRSKESCIVRL